MSMPDPAIAPGVDPDVDTEPTETPDVAIRNIDDEITVIGVGAWPTGEVMHVPAWLAARLLQSPARFVEADKAKLDDANAESDTAPTKAGRRTRTIPDAAPDGEPASTTD